MRRLLILMLLVAATFGCASTTPTPANFTPNLITVTAGDSTPFWSSMILKEFRERANRRAGYEIVTKEKAAPYVLDVRIVNKARRATGGSMYGGVASYSYRYRIEARADLKDASGKTVWEWEGWDTSKSEERAVAGLAAKAVGDLEKAGLLKPGGLAREPVVER